MLGTRRIYVTIRRHTVRPETILYGSRVLHYDTCTPPPVNNLGPRPTQLIIYQRSFHPDILIFPRLGSSFVQKRKGRRRERGRKKSLIFGAYAIGTLHLSVARLAFKTTSALVPRRGGGWRRGKGGGRETMEKRDDLCRIPTDT